MSAKSRVFVIALAVAALSLIVYLIWPVDYGRHAREFNAKNAWIKQETPQADNLIVFVHGIFGNGADTWASSSDVTLPKLMAGDPQIAQESDVLVYEYDSPAVRDAGKITDVAEGLDAYLDHVKVWKTYKKVIFVGHSMGGLVIRQFLIAHRGHAPQVAMIYLYATPTNGSEIATVASKISGNSALKGMIPLEGSDFLTTLYTNWTNAPELQVIPTFCAYEGQDTYGVRVVSQSSASALCNKARLLDANHIQIVKPADRDDPRYYYSRDYILQFLPQKTQPTTAGVPTPAAGRDPVQSQPKAKENTANGANHEQGKTSAQIAEVKPLVTTASQVDVVKQVQSDGSGRVTALSGSPAVSEAIGSVVTPPTSSAPEVTSALILTSLRRYMSTEKWPHSRKNAVWYIWLDDQGPLKGVVENATYTFNEVHAIVPANVNKTRGAAKFGAADCNMTGRIVVDLYNRQPVAADFSLCEVRSVSDWSAVPR